MPWAEDCCAIWTCLPPSPWPLGRPCSPSCFSSPAGWLGQHLDSRSPRRGCVATGYKDLLTAPFGRLSAYVYSSPTWDSMPVRLARIQPDGYTYHLGLVSEWMRTGAW